MEDLFEKIVVICIVFLVIAVFMTIVQILQKKKLIIENKRFQEIIEAKNRQVQDVAIQNKVLGDTLKGSLEEENKISSIGASDGKNNILAGSETGSEKDIYIPAKKEKCLNLVLELERIACEKNNINFKADISADVRLLPFSETDLVSLLYNLLDNAIEAASSEESPYINFQIKSQEINAYDKAPTEGLNSEKKLEILIENSKKSYVKPLENNFATTKDDKSVHGRGVGIIKEIVKKYHGDISWEDSGDSLITKITV